MYPQRSPRATRTSAPGVLRSNIRDRQPVVATHHDGRRVHYVEPVRQYLIVCQLVIARRRSVFHRVSGVNPVDLGRLDQHVRADLDGAQGRRGIRRKKGIARAGRQDHDPAFFKVTYGTPADVVLAHLVDLQRRHDTGDRLQRVPARPAAQAH